MFEIVLQQTTSLLYSYTFIVSLIFLNVTLFLCLLSAKQLFLCVFASHITKPFSISPLPSANTSNPFSSAHLCQPWSDSLSVFLGLNLMEKLVFLSTLPHIRPIAFTPCNVGQLLIPRSTERCSHSDKKYKIMMNCMLLKSMEGMQTLTKTKN